MTKKEYSKIYFSHILLNRLETQNRKGDLRFFRPSLFKMLYRSGERNFVNDILIPHIDTLKIYYSTNGKEIQIITYRDIESLLIEDSILRIKLNNQVHTIYTPINKERGTLLMKNFLPMELKNDDLALATIDHFPSIIETKNNINLDTLYSYCNNTRINAKKMNTELKQKIEENKSIDTLWKDLVKFYKESPIELVHSKYNNREGR
ncbi:hypothetical protein [Myroides odoratimimus]|uniref:hypothetical protein n=1 Tax=Myroides odoratimimus TaxID=76832 RepID=UPI0025784EEB|nr:hypothetical protein [Myroides odoratimimus]MDM1059747.1 hypothetical protein [Myroides odoratimimus]